MTRVLLVDNYDSFTYNLEQALRIMGAEVLVHRNDQITVAAAKKLAPTHLVISPGPGRPDGAGVSLDMLAAFCGRIPVLGVCLGHQAIGQHFGGRVTHAPRLMHGKSSSITHDRHGLFHALPTPMQVARYHSLIVEDLPDALVATAFTDDGELMGVRHREWPVYGVQFHPESVLTPLGDALLGNFVAMLR
jgi:anthranilate synthase/aminodeoxychorismate synthase-like glutamine amidotransferase